MHLLASRMAAGESGVISRLVTITVVQSGATGTKLASRHGSRGPGLQPYCTFDRLDARFPMSAEADVMGKEIFWHFESSI